MAQQDISRVDQNFGAVLLPFLLLETVNALENGLTLHQVRPTHKTFKACDLF